MKIRWLFQVVYISAIFFHHRTGCKEVATPKSSGKMKFLQKKASLDLYSQNGDSLSLDSLNRFPVTELLSSFSNEYHVHSSRENVPPTKLNKPPKTPTSTVLNTDHVLSSRSVNANTDTSKVVQSSLFNNLNNIPTDEIASFSEISYESSDLYSDVNSYNTESLGNFYENDNKRTYFIHDTVINSFVKLESSADEVSSIVPVPVDKTTVRPPIVVRSVDIPDKSDETYVPVAEDRIGIIEDDVDNSADSLSGLAQLHPLDFSTTLREQVVTELKKETRQNNPSIEHLISGLVNLLGGDVKTSQRRPHSQPPQRPPYRRPPRLPLQPKPSLVKIPSFASSSRINHRGPPKFSGVRPGVNIGIPTNPNYTPQRPAPTSPSIYLSTKKKPNRWEWPNFSDKSTKLTSEISSTSYKSVIKTFSNPSPSSAIQPSLVKSDSTTISPTLVSSTPSVIKEKLETSDMQFKKPGSKPITELIVSFVPTFSLEKPSKTVKPEILTSKSTKTTSHASKSYLPSSSNYESPSVIMEVQDSPATPTISANVLNNIQPTKTSTKLSSISSTTLNRVSSQEIPKSIDSSFSTLDVSQESLRTESIKSTVFKSSVITGSQVATTNSAIVVTNSHISEWKPVSDVKDRISITQVQSSISEISIITAPSIIDITVTNKMSGSTKIPEEIFPTKPIEVTKKPSTKISSELKPTRLPTTLSTPFLPTKKPTFILNERPKPASSGGSEVITLSGEGSFKPNTPVKHLSNYGLVPSKRFSKIPPINNKPSLTTKPNPSRPSSIGRPTVIPVEIDEFRNKPNKNIFQNRRPGSGNAQVVGAGIRFVGSSSEGLRPVRPVSRPKPHSNYKPNLPPIRIDTCVVGEDSTCDHKLNEQCRTEQGVSSCVCGPGYARTGSRGPCFSVVSLAASIRIDRYGPRRISFNRKLLDETSDQYKILKEESRKAVNSVFRYSKFRGLFYGSKINKFYSIGGKIIVNTTFTLEKNPETLSDNIRQELQRELIRVIASRNQNIGDSVLYVDGPINPVPGVQDVNECSSIMYNDCGENSECENIFGSFKCSCLSGYIDKYPKDQLRSGRHCSTCPSSFCNNHGDCVVKNGKQKCVCKGSYIGDKCETDGEVLGVALGVSLAAVFIIILTLVCLCNWSRRWRREEQKIDRASGRTSGSSGNTFTYIDKSGNNGGPNSYHMDDRLRWPPQLPEAMNNYYGSEPGQPIGNHSLYGGLFPQMPSAPRPMPPKSPKHIENQYHVPRPRSRAASLTGSGFYDSDYSRDIYNNPGGRNSGYAIPLRPMRS